MSNLRWAGFVVLLLSIILSGWLFIQLVVSGATGGPSHMSCFWIPLGAVLGGGTAISIVLFLLANRKPKDVEAA